MNDSIFTEKVLSFKFEANQCKANIIVLTSTIYSSFSPVYLSLNAYDRLFESALTHSSLKQSRQFRNPSNFAPFSTWSQCPSLKGTEKDVSPVSRYKAAPLHCHLQIQASHCESGRKTKERKKKGKRNWVIDKRASSGVGLRNVFITAQKGFEKCFGVEKCVNCRVLDTSLSRFFLFMWRYNRICK